MTATHFKLSKYIVHKANNYLWLLLTVFTSCGPSQAEKNRVELQRLENSIIELMVSKNSIQDDIDSIAKVIAVERGYLQDNRASAEMIRTGTIYIQMLEKRKKIFENEFDSLDILEVKANFAIKKLQH